MAPLPKRRHSSRRSGKRERVALKRSLRELQVCPKCGTKKLPHRICPKCGFYK
ncbi:50S ribosomal protein L32 [Candidatus Gottesmanbacteria bacterium]|nr:50S ribosomal protein L32 [Candidatus Gottesmanbacteria bacterium]